MSLSTPITKLFGIKHPVILAGMNVSPARAPCPASELTLSQVAAGPDLAAAVTNAGGLGCVEPVEWRTRMPGVERRMLMERPA